MRAIQSMPLSTLSLSLILISSLAACGTAALDQEEPELLADRPDGWTEASHGKDAPPNYDVVFAPGKVMRMDLTISAENWQAMLADMTAMSGEFGNGNGMGVLRPSNEPPETGQPAPEGVPAPAEEAEAVPLAGETQGPPPEAFAACEGKNVQEQCTIQINGQSIPGICTPFQELLACKPEGDPGVPGDKPPVPGDEPGGPGGPGGPGITSTENPIYVPCEITFEGQTWNHVGLRFKGLSSLRMSWSAGVYKLPFRLDFDEFEDDYPEIDDQRFHGFKKLSLGSNWGDSSLLHEKMANDILAEAGVPVAHSAFYRLYIDHGEGPIYFGLYTLTEIPHDPMLSALFKDGSGNLYKPDGTAANLTTFDEVSFDKETNKDEADFSDVKAAIAALSASRADPEAWRAQVEQVLDPEGFLQWLATNTVFQNWDVYGNIGHNYYLYGDPGDGGRLHWIPWDHNGAFGSNKAHTLELDEVTEKWPYIRYLLDDPHYQAIYYANVEQVAGGAFAEAQVQAQFKAAHALIAPYVVGDEGEQQGYSHLRNAGDFEKELDRLLEHVTSRHAAVREVLGRK